jgi:hypothetical protein
MEKIGFGWVLFFFVGAVVITIRSNNLTSGLIGCGIWMGITVCMRVIFRKEAATT